MFSEGKSKNVPTMRSNGKKDEGVLEQQNQDWVASQLTQNIEALRNGVRSRIPWVFCAFAGTSAPVKLEAAQALCEVLDILSFNEIIRVEEQMRQTTSMEWGINWRALDMNDFFTDQMNSAERRAVCVFASFNPNGFIREQATLLLQEYNGTLPYILLRLNDWVNQVRQAASAAFHYRLQRLSNAEIIVAMPFAHKLKMGGRGNHDEYLKLFLMTVTSLERMGSLHMGLADICVTTRRLCTDALFDAQPPRTKLAFARLVSEPDPFLRGTIFKKLAGLGQNMNNAAGTFLNDAYPMNRLLAFQYLLDASDGGILDIAEKLLLDTSARVREAAQKTLLQQTPGRNFREFYRACLTKHAAIAIPELGKKGVPGDAEEIAPYLESAHPRIISAAMTALMRLDAEKYRPVITEMLADTRPGIVKTARNLIMKYGPPDYDRVWAIFQQTSSENTQEKCTDIVFAAPKWARLIFMLAVMSGNQETLRAKARDAVKRWLDGFNRSFIAPSDEQSAEIRGRIKELSGFLSPSIERGLLFALPRKES